MTVLSAQSIRERCILADYNPAQPTMISPFHERTDYNGLSFGLSSAGYDVRLDAIRNNRWSIPPGGCALGSTIEHFNMPLDLIGRVSDKSTLARQFLTVQNTIIEPGWSGYLTLELINHSPLTIDLRPGMPIAQIVFEMLDKPTVQPYTGKYQDQERGPQEARYHDFQPAFPLDPEDVLPFDAGPDPTHAADAFSYFTFTDTEQYSDDNGVLVTVPTGKHHVRKENDEWACSCGARWSVSDGEEHP